MNLKKYALLSLAVLIASSKLEAQTIHLGNGETLIYNATGARLASGGADNQSPEAGGVGGVVNLMHGSYNSLEVQGGGGNGDHGWTAVLAVTPAQVTAGTPLYTQTTGSQSLVDEWYTSKVRQSNGSYVYNGVTYHPIGWTPPYSRTGIPVPPTLLGPVLQTIEHPELVLNANTAFSSWFLGHSQSDSTPAAPFTVISTQNATIVWSGGQLHLTDSNSDTIVPIPTGWDGDVAIINMVEQGGNSSDGWNDYAYFVSTTLNTGRPTGTIAPATSRILPSEQGTVNWGVTNGG